MWAAERRAIIGRVIAVTRAGDVASVLLVVDNTSDAPDPMLRSWVDCHTLLRIKSVWKITNKPAPHAIRAASAANRQVQHTPASVACCLKWDNRRKGPAGSEVRSQWLSSFECTR